jgi:repressor LexA
MPQRRRRVTCVQIVEAIQQFRAAHGYSPTVRELGAMVHLSSPCSVQRHVVALQRAGLVVREPGKARCLLVIERPCP